MRNVCLFICISLLSSMFHAVAMPIETFHTQTVNTVAAHDFHACEEAATAPAAKPCHLSGHICCTGLTAAITRHVCSGVSATEILNPVFQILVLQDMPSQQFKPPKRHL